MDNIKTAFDMPTEEELSKMEVPERATERVKRTPFEHPRKPNEP